MMTNKQYHGRRIPPLFIITKREKVTTWRLRPYYLLSQSWLVFTSFLIVVSTLYSAVTVCAQTTTTTTTTTTTGNNQVTNKFNDQLTPRVTERLDDYLRRPFEAVQTLVRFYNVSAFRSAADRQALFHHMLSNSLTNQEAGYPVDMYVSLEDGVFISRQALYQENEYFTYREPGNSGYVIDNNNGTSISVNDPNYKHWVSCFNYTDGTPRECLMWEGLQYIQCINDCELIPCRNENNDTVIDSATNETIWCKNYIVKEVQEGEQLGYIPAFDLCINQEGKPEQRPGYAVINFTSELLGNCTHLDMVTLVNNTMVGDYAACAGKEGDVCDWAYRGAQYEIEYEARTTSWYRPMKQKQVAEWADPYFYDAFGATLATSYEHPLHKIVTDDKNPGKTKIVFDGVITVDYKIAGISDFLIDSFSGTEIQVVVFEPFEPYNIIASSSGIFPAKYVLLSDRTKSCPYDYEDFLEMDDFEIDSDMCDSERVSMNEIQGNSSVLYRAFAAHVDHGFPTTTTLNIKESDGIGSKAYVTQGSGYQLPRSNTISWHVIAVLPMSRATNDAATPGDGTFLALCFIGCFGFIGCLLLFVKFYSRRTERAVVQADWRFTCAFIFGCAMLNMSTFTLLGANEDPICMLRMWSFNGLFACALSPLFVKVYRMATLLNASKEMRRVAISNVTACLYTLPLIVTQLVILLIFSIVDPPRQTEQLGVGEGIGVQQITCEQQSHAFFITQVLFDGFLVLVGCILSYRTRNMDPKFGEAKQLAFSMYNIAFTGLVCILTINLVELDQLSKMILQAVGVFWASFFCSLSFVLPRLIEAANQRRQSNRDSDLTLSSPTGGLKLSGLNVSDNDNVDDKKDHVDNSSPVRPLVVVGFDEQLVVVVGGGGGEWNDNNNNKNNNNNNDNNSNNVNNNIVEINNNNNIVADSVHSAENQPPSSALPVDDVTTHINHNNNNPILVTDESYNKPITNCRRHNNRDEFDSKVSEICIEFTSSLTKNSTCTIGSENDG